VNAIMEEFIGGLHAHNEACQHRLLQRGVNAVFGFPMNQRDGGDLGDVAEACKLSQDVSRRDR
jgi:hypothetical protein